MNDKELMDWLDTDGCVDVQMPNEVFGDLQNESGFKTWKHRAFAYSYYYMVSYIYRNALYGKQHTQKFSQENIIKTLVANHRPMMYITKKDGLLEKMGYIETTTDYPVSFFMEDEILEFSLVKKLRKAIPNLSIGHSPNLSIKKPTKAFSRYNDGEYYNGTFYDFQNTHTIDIKKFSKIITDSELGYVGFYFYIFIKNMTRKFKNKEAIMTNKTLSKHIGCSDKTVSKYMILLEEKGYIHSKKNMTKQDFCLGKIYTIAS